MRVAIGVVIAFLLASGALYVTRPRCMGRIASEETSAVAGLVVILSGQAQFIEVDHYHICRRVYANPRDGRGYVDLLSTPRGERLDLIMPGLVKAFHGGEPHAGYYFYSLWGDGEGKPYDPERNFAVCATPARFEMTGRNMFVMDAGGMVCQTVAAGVYPHLCRGDLVPPLRTFPSDSELAKHWIAVGGG